MANWLLWPRSRSPVVATWAKRTRVYFTGTSSTSRGEQSGFDANKTQTIKKYNKKQHVTHHSSQNLLDPRCPIQTCDIWTVESRMSRHHGGHHNERLVCRTHSVCVGLVPEMLGKPQNPLAYHHCPHESLIYGNPCKSPLSNTPTWIWTCTDFFPTHPVVSFKKHK